MQDNEDLIKKLQEYTVPPKAVEVLRSAKIVFLVGITAAGKDTVINELLKSGEYHYIVSHTTRPPRYNHGELEQDGIHYHFINPQEVERMLDNDEFIEAKLVHNSNIYGTSVAEIQTAKDKSEIAISEIEVQGVSEYRAVSDTILPIFLLPPDFKTWYGRLTKRYGEKIDQEDLRKRMATAIEELEDALTKDYFEFVINSDLQKTVSIVDELAHGSQSSKKNEEAKVVARQLLSEIEKTLA